MNRIKNWMLPLLILFCQGCAQLLLFPQFIPSWEVVQIVLVSVLYFFALAFSVLALIRIFIHLRKKLSCLKAALMTLFPGLLMAFWLAYFYFFAAMQFGQGFLGAVFVRQYDYPAYQTTFYLYDNRFIHLKSSVIKIRNGVLPFMEDLTRFEKVYFESVEIREEKGRVLIHAGDKTISYNLRLQKVEQN